MHGSRHVCQRHECRILLLSRLGWHVGLGQVFLLLRITAYPYTMACVSNTQSHQSTSLCPQPLWLTRLGPIRTTGPPPFDWRSGHILNCMLQASKYRRSQPTDVQRLATSKSCQLHTCACKGLWLIVDRNLLATACGYVDTSAAADGQDQHHGCMLQVYCKSKPRLQMLRTLVHSRNTQR